MWRRGTTAAGLLAFLAMGAAAPALRIQPAPNVTTAAQDPDLLQRLERLDAAAAAVTDLTAEFVQRKYTPLLRQPLESSGRVRIAGTKTRWDTRSPASSVLHITPESLRIYYPDQRVIEEYPLGEAVGRLGATPLPRLKDVREHFDIAPWPADRFEGAMADEGVVGIALTPKAEQLRDRVQRVAVLLDAATGWARQVEILDADDERTVITFRDVRPNSGLTENDLALDVPPGTRISRPLEGLPPSGAGR